MATSNDYSRLREAFMGKRDCLAALILELAKFGVRANFGKLPEGGTDSPLTGRTTCTLSGLGARRLAGEPVAGDAVREALELVVGSMKWDRQDATSVEVMRRVQAALAQDRASQK